MMATAVRALTYKRPGAVRTPKLSANRRIFVNLKNNTQVVNISRPWAIVVGRSGNIYKTYYTRSSARRALNDLALGWKLNSSRYFWIEKRNFDHIIDAFGNTQPGWHEVEDHRFPHKNMPGSEQIDPPKRSWVKRMIDLIWLI